MDSDARSYKDLVNSIIRPPRESYTMEELGPVTFTIKDKKYLRKDVGLVNPRGDTIAWSHYEPAPEERINKNLPCVMFCHGNCGSRLDALPIVLNLLPHNITVFSLDFSGSGRSDGDYVSLGWYEKDDIATAVEYLRSQDSVTSIGLWGQSMGAVASLLYSSEDPLISGMVLDSPFSNLKKLWLELWKSHSKIPTFIWKIGLKLMRRTILKKAKFDISKLDVLKFAKKCTVPCKFFSGTNDDFVKPSHSEKLFSAYNGDKGLTEFEGDHNSERPTFFYDSATIFFCNLFMVDSIEDQRRSTGETLARNEAIELLEGEKIPELDSTKFRKIWEVVEKIQPEENEDLYKFDMSVENQMKRNQRRHLQRQAALEKEDLSKAVLNSMQTLLDEKEEENQVIEALEKIGLFRQNSQVNLEKDLLDTVKIQSKDLDLIDDLNDREAEDETDQSSVWITDPV